MPNHITSHNAQLTHYDSHKADFANDWWNGASAKPTIRGAAGAVRRLPRRVLGAVPGRSLVVDRLDGRKYTEKQKKLQRLGFLAAVDGNSLGERRRDRARRDRVLSIFQESGVFEQGHIVDIQTIIYATAYRDRELRGSLTRRAKALGTAIDRRKAGGETFFIPEPLVVGSRQMETTEALYEAATDLEQRAKAHAGGKDGSYVPSPSLVIVMGAGHIARTLQGPSYDEVVRSGLVTLDPVGPLPKYDFWIPRFAPSPASRPAVEREELPAPTLGVPVPEPALQAVQQHIAIYS